MIFVNKYPVFVLYLQRDVLKLCGSVLPRRVHKPPHSSKMYFRFLTNSLIYQFDHGHIMSNVISSAFNIIAHDVC